MYNNPYVNNYGGFNQQINTPDQNYLTMLDNEKGKIEKIKENYLSRFQTQQPTLNQTIQVTPTAPNVGIRYANTIDDVNKEVVYSDTPFFSKDMSVLWVKNTKGDIKTYELTEIIPKDEKDIKIEFLMAQIEELKKGRKNDESNAIIDEQITDTNESNESTNVSTISKSTKKSK